MNGVQINREMNGEAPVESLWEQFQYNNEQLTTGKVNSSEMNATKTSNHLIFFVNGK